MYWVCVLERLLCLQQTKMLAILLLPSLAIAAAVGQGKETYLNSVAVNCNSTLQVSSTPGLNSVVLDTDLNFVNDASQCTSTNQKIISTTWANLDCRAAIEAACGVTSDLTNDFVAQTWTWGLHSSPHGGSTCLAGIWGYEKSNIQLNDYGETQVSKLLSKECCIADFQAMLRALKVNETGGFVRGPGNRLSVNVETGGFPHTSSSRESDGMVQIDQGKQVDAGSPSYIIQGYVLSPSDDLSVVVMVSADK